MTRAGVLVQDQVRPAIIGRNVEGHVAKQFRSLFVQRQDEPLAMSKRKLQMRILTPRRCASQTYRRQELRSSEPIVSSFSCLFRHVRNKDPFSVFGRHIIRCGRKRLAEGF